VNLYLLDTNMVSYIINGRSPAARARLSGLKLGMVTVSAITEAELWYGVEHHRIGITRRNAVRLLLDQLGVLPWGRREAATYGAFRARQETVGKILAPLDTMIAAHAIAAGAVLVSHDNAFRHAVGLPGLEDWATDLINP
jgi:tRNA(fMet)-specific endonuclease VapC